MSVDEENKKQDAVRATTRCTTRAKQCNMSLRKEELLYGAACDVRIAILACRSGHVCPVAEQMMAAFTSDRLQARNRLLVNQVMLLAVRDRFPGIGTLFNDSSARLPMNFQTKRCLRLFEIVRY